MLMVFLVKQTTKNFKWNWFRICVSKHITMLQNLFNPFKPGFTIVIFIHYKPGIAVAILDL